VFDINCGRTPVAARVVPTPIVKTEMNANNEITTNRWLRLRKNWNIDFAYLCGDFVFFDFTGLPITEF
jgi:hypothetical protein